MVIQVKMGIEMLGTFFSDWFSKLKASPEKKVNKVEKRVSQRKLKTSSGDGTLGNGLGIMLSTPLPS